eukprot:140449-Chlamydomonas_euryale.AAC.13
MLIYNRFWRSVRDCPVSWVVVWRSDHELEAMTVGLSPTNARKCAAMARLWGLCQTVRRGQ